MAADEFQMDFDLDEDLFDFDDTLLSAEDTLADLDAALEVTMDTVADLAKSEEPVAPATSFTPQASPAPLSPAQVEEGIARRDSGARRDAAGDPASASTAGANGRQGGLLARMSASPLLAAGVLVSLLLNAALAIYAVSALSAVRAISANEPAWVADLQQVAASAPQGVADAVPEPQDPEQASYAGTLDDTDQLVGEGEHALNRARSAIEGGEYERARQVLSSLLAVADRIPSNARQDIEARARFMLADTWRLEADAYEAVLARALVEVDGGDL